VGVQLRERALGAQAFAVWPLGGHRVERVGGQNDPRLQRDVLALEAVGITPAVQALVVMTDHACLGIHAEASQQALPCRGVVLDQLVLGGRQRSRLSK
jgi:hypothetical protein